MWQNTTQSARMPAHTCMYVRESAGPSTAAPTGCVPFLLRPTPACIPELVLQPSMRTSHGGEGSGWQDAGCHFSILGKQLRPGDVPQGVLIFSLGLQEPLAEGTVHNARCGPGAPGGTGVGTELRGQVLCCLLASVRWMGQGEETWMAVAPAKLPHPPGSCQR